jgi:RNA polymerase sigma-70 factor (ECF subfamily)
MGDGHEAGRSEQWDPLGAEWERYRPAVFGAAYRLLGSVADAEDVTQDVWLRAAGADLQHIGDLRAWLVTVAARRSYDILKSARFRRETYVGPWLPEPLLTGPDASQPVLVDESVSSAMLLIMEELSPPERVAFVERTLPLPEQHQITTLAGNPSCGSFTLCPNLSGLWPNLCGRPGQKV